MLKRDFTSEVHSFLKAHQHAAFTFTLSSFVLCEVCVCAAR